MTPLFRWRGCACRCFIELGYPPPFHIEPDVWAARRATVRIFARASDTKSTSIRSQGGTSKDCNAPRSIQPVPARGGISDKERSRRSANFGLHTLRQKPANGARDGKQQSLPPPQPKLPRRIPDIQHRGKHGVFHICGRKWSTPVENSRNLSTSVDKGGFQGRWVSSPASSHLGASPPLACRGQSHGERH